MTVVVPTLNEEADIQGCIDAIARQTYPLERLEVVVVDGCSHDGTVHRVREAAAGHRFAGFVVLENPRRQTSAALNVGLERAGGSYLVRVDARSRIPPHYVETAVDILDRRPEVGVVGGSQVARARSTRLVDVAIARALRNRWSTGLSKYRTATISRRSDTVWMGVFRTDDLRRLGGWPEDFALNEDYELNRRYRASGRLVWFEASLRPEYLPRRSVPALARQYFYFGRAKGTWWARGRRPAPRHLPLLVLPLVAGGATMLVGRRAGWCKAMMLPPLGLLAVDALGSDGPPVSAPARAASAVVIAVYAMSWWTGVWVGWLRELMGARHRHG